MQDGKANSFQLTREAYEFALQRDCTQPCERIHASDGSGIDVEQDAMLAQYCLCDVCGMSGSRSRVKMEVCGTCLDHDKEIWHASVAYPGRCDVGGKKTPILGIGAAHAAGMLSQVMCDKHATVGHGKNRPKCC